MSAYRVVQRRKDIFEPQVWRWWWPFWWCLYEGSDVGGSHLPWTATTLEEAEEACRKHARPEQTEPKVIHQVTIEP